LEKKKSREAWKGKQVDLGFVFLESIYGKMTVEEGEGRR